MSPPSLLQDVLWAPAREFIDPVSRLHFGAWAAALVLAVVVLKSQGQSVRASLRWMGRVVFHRSFRVDLSWLILASVTAALVGPTLVRASMDLAIELARACHHALGPSRPPTWGRAWATLAFTLVLFLLDDLSRYLLHRALHELPWLWRFHRLHHSAVVLTPLTFKRQHPVEVLLFAVRHALVFAAVAGMFLYFLRGRLGLASLATSGGSVIAFQWLGANLRHSHVRWGWGDLLERAFISPAQHQVHHSRREELQRSNFGSVLSVWDGLFGTLKRSSEVRVVRFGLKNSPVRGSGARFLSQWW